MLASRCGKRKENSDDKGRGETPTTRRSSIVLWIFSEGLSAERWRKQVLSAAAPEILQVSARRDRAFFCCVSSFLGSGVAARQRLLARHDPVSTPRHRVPPGSSSSPPTSASRDVTRAQKSRRRDEGRSNEPLRGSRLRDLGVCVFFDVFLLLNFAQGFRVTCQVLVQFSLLPSFFSRLLRRLVFFFLSPCSSECAYLLVLVIRKRECLFCFI